MTPLFSGKPASTDKATIPTIDRTVLQAAAEWYVQLKSQEIDQAALTHWRNACGTHERAWQLVLQMDSHLGSMPAALALPALKGKAAQRRAVTRTLAILLAAGSSAWMTSRTPTWQAWTADARTAAGERRQITLPDGGKLDLNTDTALGIRYDEWSRVIQLHHGEIMISTASDHQATSRPFFVQTRHGTLQALGTRFSVHASDQQTRLAVFEHAVAITTRDHQTQRIEAGRKISFSATAFDSEKNLERNQDAWTRGMLIAVDQRMDDFLKELARYRRGHLQCDPSIAHLRVTGAWRLDDIDAALASLTASHAVQLRYYTRFWVQVEPSPAS